MQQPMVLAHASVESAANASAAITLPAVPEKRHYVPHLLWSYSGPPTGGRIYSTGLDGDEIDFDIIVGGPGSIRLPPANGSPNTDVTFTIAAAGAGVVGKLSISYFTGYGWGK